MQFNNPYPCAESRERTAICVFTGVGYVEIVATGAGSEIEVFGCVDPVSPIRVIGGWFQYVGFAFKRYETPAQRGRSTVCGNIALRGQKRSYSIYFSRIQTLELD